MASKKVGSNDLNPQQIKFCKAYVEEEFFCNGTKAYGIAYPDAEYSTCKVEASKFLTNPNILEYIDSLLEDMALNDQRVDKELAKLLLQDDERNIKLGAIKEYNTLRARIEKGRQKALDKGEITTDVITKDERILISEVIKQNLG